MHNDAYQSELQVSAVHTNGNGDGRANGNGHSNGHSNGNGQTAVVDGRANPILDKLVGWDTISTTPLKDPVAPEAISHRDLLEGEFWQRLPGYADVDTETFLDHKWQARQSVTNLKRLQETVGELAPQSFYDDVEAGRKAAPMAMRISPYLMALMNWEDPYNCPLRTQFMPVRKNLMQDHPKMHLDSLHEQDDSPVPGLTHRYIDKALFLPLNTCPVYCRFCTRSYSIGADTEEVTKVALRVDYDRWRAAFAYVQSRPELEDIVISGGDAFNLRADQLEAIGTTLLNMPNIRRLRIATKGLAIMPQKILSDDAWLDAVTRLVKMARGLQKEVVIHTHFNHPSEITWISREALAILHERGVIVRNQAVMQRGVNDSIETMITLVRRLAYINVQPYYVYVCDMVPGVEDLRTSIATAERIEKHVRGTTAGFNTPMFVCDAPGGGGKRDLHSYEYYNRDSGIAVYTAPSIKPGKFFLYFDPLHSLSEEYQQRWQVESEQQRMVEQATSEAKRNLAMC